MFDTYNCDYLQHSTFRINLIDFQLNTDFPSQFFVFYRLKRAKTRRLFFAELKAQIILLL